MKRMNASAGAGALVLGLGVFASFSGACGDDRGGFTDKGGVFDPGGSPDAGPCPLQCSLDGRSVIRSCTGEVVTACPPDLACGAATCQEPCAASAADRSSNGCDFRFQAPQYRIGADIPQSCYATFVVNTSNKPAEVELEFEGKKRDLSKALFRTHPGEATLELHEGPLAPGESAILFVSDRDPSIPRTFVEKVYYVPCPRGVVPAVQADVRHGTGIHPSFHLTSNVPVGLTAIYPFGGALTFIPSATLLLPVSTWGKQHIVVDGWEKTFLEPATQFFASEDDTELTILPSRDIQNGNGVVGAVTGAPQTYHLDKGQFLQIVQTEELSGSFVWSNKPTSTVGGNVCASVPLESACETLGQQIPAVESWGSEYVGVGYRPRLGNEHEVMYYRIVAARDGTRLDYDPALPPGAPVTMSAGEVVTFESGTGEPFVVRTNDVDHPVYLGAYMTGESMYGRRGDPEFVNVVPAGQYLNAYSFYADPTYAETSLVIVRAKGHGELKDVWLECAGNLTAWRPVGTRGAYEFTRVDLSRAHGPGDAFGDSACKTGLNRMKSDGPFTATIWGWDTNASYAYPGGMAQRKLVLTPFEPIR